MENFKKYIADRHGLSMDVAYASMLNFPTNSFEYSFSPRRSLWITPTFHAKNKLDFLKVMGVLRYEWYDMSYYKKYFPNSKLYANSRDFGIAASGEFENFSIQFEAVGRNSASEIAAGVDGNGNQLYTKDQNSDFQYVGSFSYSLTKQIALSYSLGNRFKPVLNPTNTLISLLSLNFGFGGKPEENIK